MSRTIGINVKLTNIQTQSTTNWDKSTILFIYAINIKTPN